MAMNAARSSDRRGEAKNGAYPVSAAQALALRGEAKITAPPELRGAIRCSVTV